MHRGGRVRLPREAGKRGRAARHALAHAPRAGGLMDKIVLRAEPSVKELLPGFLQNRRRDLERLHEALHAGDLAAVRDVGQNIRCFSRVYGLDELTEMGEEIRAAAESRSTLRVLELQRRLADYLARVELEEEMDGGQDQQREREFDTVLEPLAGLAAANIVLVETLHE